jgi:mono/diheme cytochrome c family protein
MIPALVKPNPTKSTFSCTAIAVENEPPHRREAIKMTRVQIEIFLGVVLITLTSILLVIYGFNEEKRMEEFTLAQEAQAIEVGAYLFENNCASCHGKQGEGIPGLCPPLNDRNFFTNRLVEVGWSGTLEDYIVATVSSGRLTSTRPDLYVGGGRPAMPAWSEDFAGPLRNDQIRDIARFVLNWEATALEQVELVEVVAPGTESDDPVVRGEAVYTANGCGGCHTLGALSAGVVGPPLTEIGIIAETREEGISAEEYIRTSILNPNAYVVEGYPENVMPQNWNEIFTDDQLSDLVAFLLDQK